MKKYYVYAYLREDRYSPYYIGKGQRNRIHSKEHSVPLPPTHRRVKIRENMCEEDSLQLERLYISMWGRKCDGGVLYNQLEGGEQPPNPKGKKQSPEHLKRRVESKKGYRHSEETKQKMREKALGRKVSKETKQKMSASHRGTLNGNYRHGEYVL